MVPPTGIQRSHWTALHLHVIKPGRQIMGFPWERGARSQLHSLLKGSPATKQILDDKLAALTAYPSNQTQALKNNWFACVFRVGERGSFFLLLFAKLICLIDH